MNKWITERLLHEVLNLYSDLQFIFKPLTEVGQQGKRLFQIADSNPERWDHQVALIAQSVEHRTTNLRVVGSIPTIGFL